MQKFLGQGLNSSHCSDRTHSSDDAESPAAGRPGHINLKQALPLVTLPMPKGRCGGLRPLVSTEAPPIIFATPTKLSSSSTAYDYAGKNKVPELQKFFQIIERSVIRLHLRRRGSSNSSYCCCWKVASPSSEICPDSGPA
ncbi:uncharacterized protein LOC100516606 isoform X3 [Sus scrofa]|uniref:uncharacterized protein LOC100516606 isoform X3 n=1 Tax=Sus scrofa TaxID=9823 RepID=UPI000A2B3503|nr:uncharacterized protein LOC100516606 isoform X3 [Sus scrofa]